MRSDNIASYCLGGLGGALMGRAGTAGNLVRVQNK